MAVGVLCVCAFSRESSILVVTRLTRYLFSDLRISAMLSNLLTHAVFMLAFPLVATQESGKTEGSGNAFLGALAGAAAGRVIRDVASHFTGTCPSYCVEGDLYAVSTLNFLLFAYLPVYFWVFRDRRLFQFIWFIEFPGTTSRDRFCSVTVFINS